MKKADGATFDLSQHPLKAEIEAVIKVIRTADPAIVEGIKWNAPSFRLDEYFATVNLRSQNAVQIILHLGAKARPDIVERIKIEDPGGLLEWLGKDRASVRFADMKEIKTKGPAFKVIIKNWIIHLKS